MRHGQQNVGDSMDNAPIVLRMDEVWAFFRRQGAFVSGAMAAVALAGIAVTLIAYATAPSRVLTTLPFRLQFEGAEEEKYPNGTEFRKADIVSNAVLSEAYVRNNLQQFVEFQTFSNAVFVTESGDALAALTARYAARLADSKLSVADRQRLEDELEAARQRIRRNDLALNLLDTNVASSIPNEVRMKALADVLKIWAENSVHSRGVSQLDTPMLSSSVFDSSVFDSHELIIALDIVRRNMGRVQANLRRLAEIQGADVLRTAEGDLSLEDVATRLEDLRQFRLQPLMDLALERGLSEDPSLPIDYLSTRLADSELARRRVQSQVDLYRSALMTYSDQAPQTTGATAFPVLEQTPMPVGFALELSKDTLNRIIELSIDAADKEYKRLLVDKMVASSEELVPLASEAEFYRTTLESAQRAAKTRQHANAERLVQVKRKAIGIVNEARTAAKQMTEFYEMLSQNINPPGLMYIEGAPVTTTVSTFEFRRFSRIMTAALFVSFAILLAVSVIRDSSQHRRTATPLS